MYIFTIQFMVAFAMGFPSVLSRSAHPSHHIFNIGHGL